MNKLSTMKTVDIGVSQGSVFGPPLFLLYVNDFDNCIINESDSIQYADDTAILILALTNGLIVPSQFFSQTLHVFYHGFI